MNSVCSRQSFFPQKCRRFLGRSCITVLFLNSHKPQNDPVIFLNITMFFLLHCAAVNQRLCNIVLLWTVCRQKCSTFGSRTASYMILKLGLLTSDVSVIVGVLAKPPKVLRHTEDRNFVWSHTLKFRGHAKDLYSIYGEFVVKSQIRGEYPPDPLMWSCFLGRSAHLSVVNENLQVSARSDIC